MTEKRSVMKNHLPKRLFNSGNINLIPKFHGENLKIDGLLNRLVICLNIYCFVLSFCFIVLFTSSSPCREDQFAVLYFSR